MPKGGGGNGGGNGGGGGSQLLAVAFTDRNGNDQFEKKELIAAIEDTNKNGIIDDNSDGSGDTVVFGTYPLHTDGTGIGTFTNAETAITGVYAADSFHVGVFVDPGFSVEWAAFPSGDQFSTSPTGTTSDAFLVDSFDGQVLDSVQVISGLNGPGEPDTSAQVFTPQAGDNGFLDVLIA